jgi:hypothetical protein
MTETEVNALLDAHDVLVKTYLDANLTFAVFVSATINFRTIMHLTDMRR